MPQQLIVRPYDPALGARKQITMQVPFFVGTPHTYTDDVERWLGSKSITQLADEKGIPLSVLTQHILLSIHPHLKPIWPQARWSDAQRQAHLKKREGYNK